jgi:hypothetical protein
MQPRHRRVVRHPNVCAARRQFVERTLLGAVRIRRRQNAHRLSRTTVALNDLEQRANTAEPNERHYDIDGLRRIHLRAKLVPNRRFARSIREDRRVEERREWPFDRFERAVGPSRQKGVQNLTGLSWKVQTQIGDLGDGVKTLQHFPGKANSFSCPFSLWLCFDCLREQARYMARDSIGGFGVSEVCKLGL